ncbi:hypothetical protein XENOCAPTIV_000341 [Xenoophorus captivus]|uniref:Ig-like domain-containing protein n=1 Tax=Xenoophorus captivus TaxID=1517983 RepID=A0ABV0SAL5_9TELE
MHTTSTSFAIQFSSPLCLTMEHMVSLSLVEKRHGTLLICLQKGRRETTMALLWFSGLTLVILTLIPQRSLGCPFGCRCYSLTVECGSLGIKEIPQGKQHRVANRAGSVWLIVFGSAGPRQESPPHFGSLVSKTPRQHAGAPYYSLAEVAPNSLVCIPPVVQLEPSHLTVRLGESLRVSCQASGYPQPQVTWKKASMGKAQLSPRGLFQELGPNGELFRPGPGGMVTALPSNREIKMGAVGGIQGLVRGAEEGGERDSFDPDMGSGMLFLSNVTVAHAGRYECEAWNPGGVARVTFHLAVNMSSSSYSSQLWPRLNTQSYVSLSSSSFYQPEVLDVSQEPLYEQDSMDFSALGPATQTAIAIGISLLALTAVLLLIMIYTRHQQYQKEDNGSYCTTKEESILYVNDYSDGPTTFAQLEEYRDDHGHEMYVLNRTKPVMGSTTSRCPMISGFVQQKGMKEALLEHEMVQTLTRSGGLGFRRNPAEGGEGPLTTDPEEMLLSQSLLFGSQVAYEIHC